MGACDRGPYRSSREENPVRVGGSNFATSLKAQTSLVSYRGHFATTSCRWRRSAPADGVMLRRQGSCALSFQIAQRASMDLAGGRLRIGFARSELASALGPKEFPTNPIPH